MKNPNSSAMPPHSSDRKERTAATVAFAALALLYAASGILNALQAASTTPAGVLRETVLVLVPSIPVVMMVLWITQISDLSRRARRFALVATLIAAGFVAMISNFGL